MYNFKIITGAVISDSSGRFLLGKRSMDEDVFPGLWSVPAGKLERGPARVDVLEANVLREVKEELGVDIEITDYLESHSDGGEKIYIIFLGRIVCGIPLPLDCTDELGWFSFDELKDLKLCPHIHDLLQKAGNAMNKSRSKNR